MKTEKETTLLISFEDIKKIIFYVGINQLMDELIHNLESAFLSFDSTKIKTPARSGFNYTIPNIGLLEWMPLLQEGEEVMLKMVGYHPQNPSNYNYPTILSNISRYSTQTGHLKSIIDGTFLTAFRTGAASAVATKYMAKVNSKILGLIGCGTQAITQLHALSRIYDFEKVLIYDIDNNTINSFDARCKTLQIDALIYPSSINTILSHSDIICTATSINIGEGRLFHNTVTKPWLHINAVGSDFPGKIEIPLSFLNASFVCPDHKEQAFKEGECQQLTQKDIKADIVNLVKNNANYTYVKDITSVFDSTGWALEDYIVEKLFVKYAHKLELGQYIDFGSYIEDSKNPYHFLNVDVFCKT